MYNFKFMTVDILIAICYVQMNHWLKSFTSLEITFIVEAQKRILLSFFFSSKCHVEFIPKVNLQACTII